MVVYHGIGVTLISIPSLMVYNYMNNFISNINKLEIPKIIIKPFEQLLMVYKQSSNLLSIPKLMNDFRMDIIEYYPENI